MKGTIEELRKIFTPKIKQCVACDKDYEYYKKGCYLGKNPKRCITCQLEYQERTGKAIGNSTWRPGGHTTRQQHKKTNPKQL